MVSILFLITAFPGTAAPSHAPKPARPAWPLPWSAGTTYRYSWYLSTTPSHKPSPEGPNGTTTFALSWHKAKEAIISKGNLDLRTGLSRLQGRFFTIFDPTLRPRLYVSRFSGTVAGQRTGSAGVSAAFTEKAIKIRLGTSAKTPVETLTPPPDYRLYGHQAIQHWAIFCSFLQTGAPSSVRVLMPDILRFFTMSFVPEGTEETCGLPATRLRFTAEGLFRGKVWIGPQKRLLRYHQDLPNGCLDIYLSLPEDHKLPTKAK